MSRRHYLALGSDDGTFNELFFVALCQINFGLIKGIAAYRRRRRHLILDFFGTSTLLPLIRWFYGLFEEKLLFSE